MKKFLFLAILSLLPLGLQAAEEEVRYYDVELIIFEDLAQKDRLSEIWPTSVDQTLPESEKEIEIGQPYPGPVPKEFKPAYTFKPLSKDKYKLDKEAKLIDDSSSRRVLLHTAWRQPGMGWENAINVHLKKTIPGTVGETAAGDNAILAGEAGELEGYVKVILSRYLHVDTDMAFRTQPQTDVFDFSEDTREPVAYRLKQLRRRIRSTELHYLDNPVLGMLIMMTPVETDKL